MSLHMINSISALSLATQLGTSLAWRALRVSTIPCCHSPWFEPFLYKYETASSTTPKMALTAMAAFALAEVLLFPLWGDNEEVDCAADAASWGPAVDELHAVVPELSVVPVAPGLVDV